MMTTTHFAELLYRANIKEEIKEEIMNALPKLSQEKREALYETLVNFDQQAQKMVLSFQVDLGKQRQGFEEELQKSH